MMKWGLGAIGVGVAGLIAVTALGLGGASAQTPAPSDTDTPGGRYTELLAEELGISVDELNEARLSARNAAIDELVAEGKLTQEQGEEMKSHELGEGFREHFGKGPGGKLVKAVVNVFQSAADIIGLPVEEVRERIAGGESLAEIAQSEGISADELKADLVAKLTTDINAAVASGELSQERANMLLEHLDEMVERAINHEGGQMGQGFEGMRRFGPGNRN
jgi:uncharacterized protein YidB (DUF937 family)